MPRRSVYAATVVAGVSAGISVSLAGASDFGAASGSGSATTAVAGSANVVKLTSYYTGHCMQWDDRSKLTSTLLLSHGSLPLLGNNRLLGLCLSYSLCSCWGCIGGLGCLFS